MPRLPRTIRTRPSATTVRTLLEYFPRRGLLRWRVDRGRTAKAGDAAGTVRNTDGQVVVTVKGRQYLAQRLIWLYVHGKDPEGPLVFIDHNPTNLKWANIGLKSNHLSPSKAASYQRERREAIRMQRQYEAQQEVDRAAAAAIGASGRYDHATGDE
jgi:hypothetical protein